MVIFQKRTFNIQIFDERFDEKISDEISWRNLEAGTRLFTLEGDCEGLLHHMAQLDGWLWFLSKQNSPMSIY